MNDELEAKSRMGLLRVLRGGADGETSTLYECRNCGTKLPPDVDECPDCESTEIACYTF